MLPLTCLMNSRDIKTVHAACRTNIVLQKGPIDLSVILLHCINPFMPEFIHRLAQIFIPAGLKFAERGLQGRKFTYLG